MWDGGISAPDDALVPVPLPFDNMEFVADNSNPSDDPVLVLNPLEEAPSKF